MTQETRSFQAEVSRLLDIVAHSLYSEKEIFLRELISNASDACDRLRYAALTEPALAEGDADYRVVLTPIKSSRTLTIADNGIGMNHDELVENLGTIARSGTAAFVSQLSGDAAKGHEPDRPVRRRLLFRLHGGRQGRGAEPQGRRRARAGAGSPTARASSRSSPAECRARHHASRCICARATTNISSRTGCGRSSRPIPTISRCRSCSTDGSKEETVNTASALWTRPRAEITAEQYKEFYHHVGHSFDEPWLTLHAKAEGVLEYT